MCSEQDPPSHFKKLQMGIHFGCIWGYIFIIFLSGPISDIITFFICIIQITRISLKQKKKDILKKEMPLDLLYFEGPFK